VQQDFGALDAMRVTFLNLATQRETTLDADANGDELSVIMDGFAPTPGQVYKVTVTWSRYGGGIFPVQVYPYEYVTDGFDISATAHDHLLVKFVKNHNTTGVDSASEQWLSLPI
jgi:hypothetical protein